MLGRQKKFLEIGGIEGYCKHFNEGEESHNLIFKKLSILQSVG
jgi:hypothetical protein